MVISACAFSQTSTTSETTKTTIIQPANKASQEKIAKESKLNLKRIERPEKSTSRAITPAKPIAKKETEIKEEK